MERLGGASHSLRREGGRRGALLLALLLLALALLVLGAPRAQAQAACTSDAQCDDGNPCTDEICDAFLGCRYANNSASCSDGNSCTTGDVCSGGTCVGGNRAAGCSACAAVANLPSQGGVFSGTTSGTSSLSGSCGTSGRSGERVYRWTAPSSGRALIETCGSATQYDTVVYLRGGSCTGGELACNDDSSGCTISTGQAYGSRITPTVSAGQSYWIVVDGWDGRMGNFRLSVSPPSLCGNNLREGAEECDGTDSAACPSGRCDSLCRCVVPTTGLPDLMPSIRSVNLVRNSTVPAGDVLEGCAGGTSGRDLLRFGTFVDNQGTADLFFGDPRCPSCSSNPGAVCGNPDFVCSPAGGHNHPHYDNYATYELLNEQTGAVVASGAKRSFCLEDSSCVSPARPVYTCSYQGITKGCGDLYGSSLGCQYVDVTGVPSGTYRLRVVVDPFQRIAELNEGNNVASQLVTLSGGSGGSGGSGACASPGVIPPGGGTVSGTTSGASTLSGCLSATGSAPERVFSWTPSRSGTATLQTCGSATRFDTVLSVRGASCATGSNLACNDDTSGCTISTGQAYGSRVTLSVVAGQTYHVIVDGYGGSGAGSSGAFTLSVTLP